MKPKATKSPPLRPRSGSRRGQASFSRFRGSKLPARSPSASRVRASPWRIPWPWGSAPASRAPELPRRSPVPRSRRNKSEGSAEQLRARGEGGCRAPRRALGAPGSPNSRYVHLSGPGGGGRLAGLTRRLPTPPSKAPNLLARGRAQELLPPPLTA